MVLIIALITSIAITINLFSLRKARLGANEKTAYNAADAGYVLRERA